MEPQSETLWFHHMQCRVPLPPLFAPSVVGGFGRKERQEMIIAFSLAILLEDNALAHHHLNETKKSSIIVALKRTTLSSFFVFFYRDKKIILIET